MGALDTSVNKGTLFIAPLGARNKKEAIFQELVSRYPESDYSSVLYLVPNNFVLSTVKNQFFSYLKKHYKKSTYIPFQSMTIKQLSLHLNEAMGDKNVISERIKVLMLYEMLKEKNIGYARLLSELFEKIKHYILDKDLSQLKEEIKQLIFEEKSLLRAVKAIETLERYEEELSKKGLIDSESLLRNSISLIGAGFSCNGSAFRVDTLVIDGFFDPTPLELEIMKLLMEKAGNVYILAEEDTEFLKYFESHDSDNMVIKRLERTIYRESTGYYSYPSMEDEVEGIARSIKKLVLEGVKPWEITVCFPTLPKYLPMLRRIFQRHGIPISIEEYNLSATGAFIALEEMINCVEEDYPRNDFLSVVLSPYFPLIPEIIKEWAVTFSYRAGIVKGKDSWLSVKEILMNAPLEEISEDDKKLFDKFQKNMKKIINAIEKIKQQNNIRSFIDVFESTLNTFGFFNTLDAAQSPRYDEIARIINAQFTELRCFANQYESAGAQTFYLRYLLRDLKGIDKNREGVKILSFELAAGLETKELFFGGMIEEDFPSRPNIDPILPEKVKKALGIPYLEYYLNRQRSYFKRLLNVSKSEPYFSYYSADGDKIFLPSPFLDWGKAMSPVELNIFSEEDVLLGEGVFMKNKLLIFRDAGIPHSSEKVFDNRDFPNFLWERFQKLYMGFFNVTDIDFYRRCPFRFYIEKVLGLEIEKPPRFEVEYRLWGSLAHKTMESLFKEGDIALEDMDEKLMRQLETSLKQFPIGDFWRGVAREIFRKLLPVLKEQEREIRSKGFSPYMVEKTMRAEVNSLKLKGKIDRIDRKIQKQEAGIKNTDNKQQNTVLLLDYKTGSSDSDSLQLPLYAGIWQRNYPEPVEKLGFYSLKDGRISWYPRKIEIEEFIQNALHFAEELVKAMKNGEFPAEPIKDSECRYCYHSPLCKGAI